MPLSNVFRHSLPNPFHGVTTSRRKASSNSCGHRHHKSHHYSRSRSGSVSSLTHDGIVVVTPVAEVGYKNMKDSADVKNENIMGKNKMAKSDSLSSPSSSSSSSGLITQLGISKAQASVPSPPLSRSQTPLFLSSCEDTPTSASFSPAPPSPGIHMPPSPCPSSSPSAPTAPCQRADRGLTSSPEPMTPSTPTATVPKTASGGSGTGTIGSKFGSRFFKAHSSQLQQRNQLQQQQQELHHRDLGEEHILPILQHDNQTPSQGFGQREKVSMTTSAMQEKGDKKKRVSSGSLHIPISAFLLNTFRPKQQSPTIVTTTILPQMVGVLESGDYQSQKQLQQPQQQKSVSALPLSQRRKRKSLLPKLPLLDTRPRTALSSTPKSNKKNKRSLSRAIDQQVECGTGGASSTTVGAVITASRSIKGSTVNGSGGTRMLSPFYLPAALRQRGSSSNRNLDPNVRLPPTPPPMSLGDNLPPSLVQEPCPQTTQQSSRTELGSTSTDISTSLWDDWRLYSRIYHDDRWDCASVSTTDTELNRCSEDPYFPEYPERNDYWKRHCRIRERCRKHRQHHLQQRQQDRANENPVTGAKEEDLTSSLSFERNVHGGFDGDSIASDDNSQQTDQQRKDLELPPVEKLKDARKRLRSVAGGGVPRRRRQQNVRYTTYAAYMTAMQRMAKERAERRRSSDSASLALAPHVAPAPISTADSRSLDIKSNVALDVEAEQQLQQLQKKQQRQHVKRHNVTSLGSSEESRQPAYCTTSPQRQRQLDSGILFVSSTTTTAEVCASLTHEPQSRRTRAFSAVAAPKMEDYLEHQHNKTSTTESHEKGDDDGGNVEYGFGGRTVYVDKKIGGLVASYFDNTVTQKDCHDKATVAAGRDGGVGGYADRGDRGGSVGGGTKGNGFLMLQSSSGDQGSPDALSDSSHCNNNGLSDGINTKKTISNVNSANHNQTPSFRIKKEDDHCLSQPGLYASHNHILPLQQLLELQEQQQWRVRQLQSRLKQSLQRASNNQQHKTSTSSPSLLSPNANNSSSLFLSTFLSPKSSNLSPALSQSPQSPSQTSSSSSSTHSRPESPSSSQYLNGWSTPDIPVSSPSPSTTALPQNRSQDKKEGQQLQHSQQQQQKHQSTCPASLIALSSSTSLSSADQQNHHLPEVERQRQASVSPIKRESNSGHMLLMLVQGRMQYYKDGARKNVALQLEDENDDEGEYVYDDMDEDCLRHEDSIIEEEQEEEEEEEKGEKDGEEEQEQDDEYRRPRARQTSSQSLDSTKYIKGRVRACSPIFTASPLSSSPVLDASQFLRCPFKAAALTSTLAVPTNGLEYPRRHSMCLGRMRGTKARPSISYSVLPTMAITALHSSHTS